MRHRLNEIDMKGRVKVIDHIIIALLHITNPKPVFLSVFACGFMCIRVSVEIE